jgi:hypothetical protein
VKKSEKISMKDRINDESLEALARIKLELEFALEA